MKSGSVRSSNPSLKINAAAAPAAFAFANLSVKMRAGAPLHQDDVPCGLLQKVRHLAAARPGAGATRRRDLDVVRRHNLRSDVTGPRKLGNDVVRVLGERRRRRRDLGERRRAVQGPDREIERIQLDLVARLLHAADDVVHRGVLARCRLLACRRSRGRSAAGRVRVGAPLSGVTALRNCFVLTLSIAEAAGTMASANAATTATPIRRLICSLLYLTSPAPF